MLLLLMHALDKYITVAIWKDYYSTINPFMFLRNLFGALVIIGVIIAIYRRFILKVPRLFPSAAIVFKKDIREYLPLKPGWVRRESGPIIVVLSVVILIKIWFALKPG
jgi:hypothetical protein